MDWDIPEIVQKYLVNIKNRCNILLIGPGNNTTELFIHRVFKDNTFITKEEVNKILFYNCLNCPYRLVCYKGRLIQKGKLLYKKERFDKVVLRADSCLSNSLKLDDVKVVLKKDGQLILFAQPLSAKETVNTSDNFCFEVKEAMAKINTNQLEIESVSTVRDKLTTAMCVVTGKTHNGNL